MRWKAIWQNGTCFFKAIWHLLLQPLHCPNFWHFPPFSFCSKRTSANFNPYSRGNPFSNCAMILCGPLPPRFPLLSVKYVIWPSLNWNWNMSSDSQCCSMLDARGPATPAYLAQHAESGHSRWVLELTEVQWFLQCTHAYRALEHLDLVLMFQGPAMAQPRVLVATQPRYLPLH